MIIRNALVYGFLILVFNSNAWAGYYSDGKHVNCYVSIDSGEYPAHLAAATKQFQINGPFNKVAIADQVEKVQLNNSSTGRLTSAEANLLEAILRQRFVVRLIYSYPTLKLTIQLPDGEIFDTSVKRDITNGAYHNNSKSDLIAEINFSEASYFSGFNLIKVRASLDCQ